MIASTLFYPRHAATQAMLAGLIRGSAAPDPDLDVVQFDAETGGSSDRDLAVPLLPDMDEVVVARAELQFAARRIEQSVTGYRVTASSGKDVGLVLSLDQPARIAKLVLAAPAITVPAVIPPGHTQRLVVRSAEPGKAGGVTFGPPVFAFPAFKLPSDLYGPVLGGLDVVTLQGGDVMLRFPDTLGSGWLIQYAYGSEATNLAPVAFTSSVHSVTIAAAMRGLSLTAVGETPARDTILWSSANALTPDGGVQVASFTPVAQKQLAAALAAADGVTLPMALRFTAQSGGRVAIAAKTLEATYRVYPLGRDPVKLALTGDWGTLALRAPAARRPQSGKLRLVARHLGRELNGGSPPPPLTPPAAGVRVAAGRRVAAVASLAPRAGDAPGAALELVAVSVALEPVGAAEVVLEVRADAAGAPGAAQGAPVVRQCAPGDPLWVSFELAAALALAPPADGVPLWISLRTTKGEVRWFAGDGGTARASADDGQTWGEVDPLLMARTAPLVQLFHATGPPAQSPPPPLLELCIGAQPIGQIAFGGPAGSSSHEFANASTVVDGALLAALGTTTGAGRAATDVRVFSRAVVELTVAEMTLDYDPLGGS
jgi:hypothetical protein